MVITVMSIVFTRNATASFDDFDYEIIQLRNVIHYRCYVNNLSDTIIIIAWRILKQRNDIMMMIILLG